MILWISQILIPLTVCYIIGFGLLSGRPVFDDFLEGAASGMKTAAGLLPVFVGLMIAVRCSEKLWPAGDSGQWLSIPLGGCTCRRSWFLLRWCVWYPTRLPQGFCWICLKRQVRIPLWECALLL